MKLINIMKQEDKTKIILFGNIKISFKHKTGIKCKKFKNSIYERINACLKNNFSDENVFYSNPYCGNRWEFNLTEVDPEKLIKIFHDMYDIDSVKKCYDLLEDSNSKELYLDILLFRLLGPQKVKLPLSDNKSWEEANLLHDKLFVEKFDETKNVYDLSQAGYDIKIITYKHWIYENLFTHQYIYNPVKPENGDYIVDGGACYGDNSCCFAAMAGENGHVYSFELSDDNIKILNKNLELNPKYKDKITVIQRALSDKSDEEFSVIPNGGATRIGDIKDDSDKIIKTLSLDDAVKTGEIKKIDFIKLDIEGAELNCLMGAKNSIKTFKPKLAISLYHCDNHYCDILLYLKSLVPEYKFYFNHHTAIAWESILYATV